MKRKLLAALLGSLGLVPLAHAQSDSGNISLYGWLVMDMQVVSPSDSSGLSVNRVESNASRLGIKGAEPLGQGYSAIFKIESLVLGDTGGSSLASWENYIGLQSSWGTVKLGRMFSPYDEAFGVFPDNVYRNNILTSSTFWANSGTNSYKLGNFTDQMNNSVRYESPVWNGLRADVQYTTAEDADHAYTVGGGVFYKAHNINAAVVYQNNQEYREIGNNDQALTVALGYDLGVVYVSGVYERLEYEIDNGQNKVKRDFYGVGATVPVGRGSLYGFWGYAGEGRGKEGARVGDIVVGDDTDAQQWTVAYNYPLSKRTSLYAGYVYIKNADNANYTFFRGGWRDAGPVGHSVIPNGTDQQGVLIGAAHFF